MVLVTEEEKNRKESVRKVLPELQILQTVQDGWNILKVKLLKKEERLWVIVRIVEEAVEIIIMTARMTVPVVGTQEDPVMYLVCRFSWGLQSCWD